MLKGSETHQNLKDAFAREAQASCRYLYFAKIAEAEGLSEIAVRLRDMAEAEVGHAHGHLDYLKGCGDPVTGLPFETTGQLLEAAVAGESHEGTDVYPRMAQTARTEGFFEIAEWFETLGKAQKSHAARFDELRDQVP